MLAGNVNLALVAWRRLWSATLSWLAAAAARSGGWRLAAAKLWLGLDFRFGGKKFKIEIDSSIWPRFGGFKLNSTPVLAGSS